MPVPQWPWTPRPLQAQLLTTGDTNRGALGGRRVSRLLGPASVAWRVCFRNQESILPALGDSRVLEGLPRATDPPGPGPCPQRGQTPLRGPGPTVQDQGPAICTPGCPWLRTLPRGENMGEKSPLPSPFLGFSVLCHKHYFSWNFLMKYNPQESGHRSVQLDTFSQTKPCT